MPLNEVRGARRLAKITSHCLINEIVSAPCADGTGKIPALPGKAQQFLQEQGEIRPDIVPQQNACILIAAVQGLAFRWILSDHRFELAEQADAVILTLIEGWAPRA